MLRDLLRVLGIVVAATLIYVVVTAMSGGPKTALPFRTTSKNKTVTSYAVVTGTADSATTTTDSVARQAGEPPFQLPKTDDVVLAKVNGEPISYGFIRAGIVDDLFGSALENIVFFRLERIIRDKATDYYLRTQGLSVAQVEIDAAVKEMRKNPPAMGSCMCCRYGSLEEYLSGNFLTLNDLKTEIRNDIGLARRVDALWDDDYSTAEKKQALLAQQRPRLEKTYINLSHIYFNTMPQSAYDGTPEKTRSRAEKKMKKAWDKLKAGQTFEAVVKSESEDNLSRVQNGKLGLVPRLLFGSEVEEKISQLTVGVVSGPVESPWGFHFFRREAIADVDWLAILKKEDHDRRTEALCDTIMKTARIERLYALRPPSER